jgi:DNA repair protein RadD
VLRDYQTKAITDCRQAFLQGKRAVMLQLPTGAGKSVIAGDMIEKALARGRRVCFVVDRLELINQMSEHLDNLGIDHGVIQGQHERFKPSQAVQVASIQTLAKRKVEAFDLYIIDEAHSFHDSHRRLMDGHNQARFLGLSATPFTKGLGRHFQQLVSGPSTTELIQAGYLVPFHVYAPSEPDLTGVSVVAGEWKEDELAEACDKPALIGDIVQTWLLKGEDRQTLCFAVNRAHSDHIREQFAAVGVAAAHLDCFTPDHERKQIIEDFKSGAIRILCNVGILTKGFDAPIASCLIYARPVRSSLALYIQMGGRVLRTAPGKTDAIILDHAGNTIRFGFLTDDLPRKLDNGERPEKAEKKAKEKQPVKCSKCAYVKPANVHSCPKCGYAPVVVNAIYTEPGQLKLVTQTSDKADLYAQLKGYALAKGKGDGYIAHLFKEQTGVWPNAYRHVVPKEPSPELLKKIQARNIRYAKGRANGRIRLAA